MELSEKSQSGILRLLCTFHQIEEEIHKLEKEEEKNEVGKEVTGEEEDEEDRKLKKINPVELGLESKVSESEDDGSDTTIDIDKGEEGI